MLKNWIARIFKIPQTYWVTYKKDGKNILVLISVEKNWDKSDKKIFSVEHLLNEDLEITEQTLNQEKEIFVDV